jgi:hypothetical protein
MLCQVPLCLALGKEFFYFLNLAECPSVWHSTKIFFLKKIICRVLTTLALDKEFFLKNYLPSAHNPDTRQRIFFEKFIAECSPSWHSAKQKVFF